MILEVPDPVRIALLGSLHMALPDADAPLILIHIDVAGTLDFGTDQLAIDGTMYDSYIAAFQLSGDMALRLNWGANPDFRRLDGRLLPRLHAPGRLPGPAAAHGGDR